MNPSKPALIHDQRLVDQLSDLPKTARELVVYRVTGLATDPIAPSISGGRWAPPASGDVSFPVLYTSLVREGAIAEIASFLANLTPVPNHRLLKISRLSVSTSETVELSSKDLERLGVDLAKYGLRDYPMTQNIGAALAFLGIDGLVTPSARWDCDNLTIFTGNHALENKLDVIDSEEFEWRSWAVANKFL
jgi:RES domain-containing protein